MLLPNPYRLHTEAYLNLRYPYQSSTEIFWSTVVERQQSQAEARRPISAFPMRAFTIDAQTLKCEDVVNMARFYEAMRGRVTSFRFRDISNFRLTSRPLITDYDASTGQIVWSQGLLVREPQMGNDQARVYQYVCVRDVNGVISYTRKPIFKLASVPQVLDLATLSIVTPTAVNYDSGIISVPGSASDLGVSVDFDTPVRFDEDKMTFDISSTNAGFKIHTNFTLPVLSPSDPEFTPVGALGYLQEDVANQARLDSIRLIEVIPSEALQSGNGNGGGGNGNGGGGN
jgi:uncharacterized protein (TIGR02217 family)